MNLIDENYINIRWLIRELYELLYDGTIDHNQLMAIIRIITKWKGADV